MEQVQHKLARGIADAPAANDSIAQRARRVMPGGIGRSTMYLDPFPPYMVYGEGAYARDADGHEIIDCSNNYTALIHGHRHPAIVQAVRSTLEWGISFGNSTPAEVRMAEVLADRIPTMQKWRFANSGTEAVMQAIRIARAATGRDVIVRFGAAYHGTYDAVVDPSAPGIPATTRDSVVQIPIGDIDALKAFFADSGTQVAGVLLDLMPNRAGMVPATREFVEAVRELTTNAGALLIVDEVISFRLAYAGFQSTYGIEPDLTTLGKVIGGGFPIGAVGGRDEVMEVTNPRHARPVQWGGTFSGNPVSLSAGMAALELFDRDAVVALNAHGDRLRERLLAADIKVTGSGSLMKVAADRPINDVWWSLYRAGVLISTSHMLSLSTAMTDEDVSRIGDVVIQELG